MTKPPSKPTRKKDRKPVAERVLAHVEKGSAKKGGVLEALRRSPLVGADLDLKREFVPPRKVDL